MKRMNTIRNRMVAAWLAGIALASAQVFAAALIGSNGKGVEYNDSIPTERLLQQRVASDKDVKVGEWHANLDKCLDYAQKNGVPLIAVWSNGDSCGHCKMFENNALSEPFRNWMAQSGMVFYFGYYGDPGKGATLGEWCTWCGGGNPRGKVLPLFRVYWPAGGVNFVTNGDTPSGYYGKCSLQKETKMDSEPYYVPGDYFTYNMGGRYAAEYFGNLVKNFKPASSYSGGEFGAPNSTTVGLQAELGVTKVVYVPLTRTNATAQANAYNNRLVYTYPGSNPLTITNKIKWVAGQKSTNIVITITGYTAGVKVGDQIKLKLLNADFNVVEKNQITFVSPVSNSTKNPYWIGEKTADTLGFGEWTMDLDVVKSKVKAFNSKKTASKAYVMVLVGGSLWCPDCVMADHWLLDYKINGVNQFTKWAKERNVALGVVDIPNYTAGGTTSNGSLLTMDMFKMSDNYVSGRGSFDKDENERYQSGAQYLSRHGITSAAAATVINRNKQLVNRDTLNGGYRRPESTTNTYRPGVPLLLVLRDNGTIAGRFDVFSSIGPSAYSANFLTRLDELLAQVDDSVEEANDDWRTTKETVTKRGTISGKTLSHTDDSDVYLIEKGAVGKSVNFKLTGTSSNTATLSIISSSNEKVPLATAKGVVKNGLSVTASILTTNCFLKVEWARSTPQAGGSSVFQYAISSDCVLVASDATQIETVTDGNPVVTLNTVAGKTYRITNVDESKIAGIFKKGASAGLYVAETTGSATIRLKNSTTGQDGKPVYVTEYQIWNTGVIGFATGAGTTKEIEKDFAFSFKVRRMNGVSGVAKVKVSLDSGDVPNDGSVFVWKNEGKTLTWKDGEDDEKTLSVTIKANSFADGDQTLSFKLIAVTGESDAGVDPDYGTMTLLIRDDDTATPGMLAITGTSLVYSKAMTVMAAPGSKISINVGRELGTDRDVSGFLKTTAGKFANGKTTSDLSWESRAKDVKTAVLTLPAYSEANKNIQVTLVSDSEATVDPERKYLMIKLAKGKAAFDVESQDLKVSAVRYIPFVTELFVNPTTLGNGKVTVAKVSGSLAPGLTYRYDEELRTVVVEGTPSMAGEWTAVFQVSEGGVPGLTTSLTVDVSELAVRNKGSDESETPINSFVATTRTIRDIIVMDSSTASLRGIVTLTIPQSGRLSAKVRLVDGTAKSFLSTGWDELSGTTLVATLRDVEGDVSVPEADTIKVKVASSGALTITTTIGNKCVIPVKTWSNLNPATPWKGYYTVSMPQINVCSEEGGEADALTAGAGYATLKMDATEAVNSGKMAYSGVLPNGKPFSGFGTLTIDPDSWNKARSAYDYALLPVISVSDTEVFSGVFRILCSASSLTCRAVFPATSFTWTHYGAKDALTRITTLDAFGSFYNANDNIEDACSATFAPDMAKLKFFALVDELGTPSGFTRGAASAWDTDYTGVRVRNDKGVNKIELTSSEAKRRQGLTFTYNPGTGIVNGAFKIDFANGTSVMARYRGVVLMHWGSGCAECSLGSDLNLRPFISGPAWFDDNYYYNTAKGRRVSVTERRGCSFSVGINAGQ